MGVIERIMDDGVSLSDWRAIIQDRPLMVSVSGGKDSTAVVLWLKEHDMLDRCFFVFADTGWEHEEVYRYLDEVVNPLCEGRLVKVRSEKYPGGMPELVVKKGMFPSRVKRFCTVELKQKPIKAYFHKLRAEGHDVINVVGIRAAESQARSKLEMWDRGGPLGDDTDIWRPLIDWLVEDIIEIHTRHGVTPCSLYLRDKYPASRVGCWPCIMSRKSEIRGVAESDPGRIDQIRELEAEVEEVCRARYAAKGETFESLGYGRPRFFQAKNDGRVGAWDIDRVVDWSKTVHGGKQYELFTAENPGCQMWGLCDMGDQ